MGKPVRILIVDDSATCRASLVRVLKSDKDIVVAGEASSGEQALELLVKTRPDLILMDILMPGIDGLKTTEKIMKIRPTPVLIISSVVGRSINMNFKALQAGALDVISKPYESQFENEHVRKQFLRKIRLLTEIPVVTRHGAYGQVEERPPRVEPGKVHVAKRDVSLLAVGASTGGPPALRVLLLALDPVLLFPVLVVQHMSTGFIGGLANWLALETGRKVLVAEHGIRPEPGVVYLAPDHYHMEYSDGAIILNDDGSKRSHRPSVDVLFESIARDGIVTNTIAVIMTGMGNDGAAGLGRIRRAGGWTIAQDKSSSVVFGMPKVAIESGAVKEVIPLEGIGERVNKIAATRSTSAAVEAARAIEGEL